MGEWKLLQKWGYGKFGINKYPVQVWEPSSEKVIEEYVQLFSKRPPRGGVSFATNLDPVQASLYARRDGWFNELISDRVDDDEYLDVVGVSNSRIVAVYRRDAVEASKPTMISCFRYDLTRCRRSQGSIEGRDVAATATTASADSNLPITWSRGHADLFHDVLYGVDREGRVFQAKVSKGSGSVGETSLLGRSKGPGPKAECVRVRSVREDEVETMWVPTVSAVECSAWIVRENVKTGKVHGETCVKRAGFDPLDVSHADFARAFDAATARSTLLVAFSTRSDASIHASVDASPPVKIALGSRPRVDSSGGLVAMVFDHGDCLHSETVNKRPFPRACDVRIEVSNPKDRSAVQYAIGSIRSWIQLCRSEFPDNLLSPCASKHRPLFGTLDQGDAPELSFERNHEPIFSPLHHRHHVLNLAWRSPRSSSSSSCGTPSNSGGLRVASLTVDESGSFVLRNDGSTNGERSTLASNIS